LRVILVARRVASQVPGWPAGLGSIKAMSFRGGCFILTAGLLRWQVNVRSYRPDAGTMVGAITGVHPRFHLPGLL
jgi:hypothetical protein